MQTFPSEPVAPQIRERRSQPGAPRREPRDSVVFVADNWGRHPSSAQHLARRLPSDVEVLWLETVGVTHPSPDLDSLRRGIHQLRRWMRPVAAEQDRDGAGVRVLSPPHWPGWKSPLAQRWNGRTLAGAVSRAASAERRILVTALPLGAVLLDHMRFDRVVYYCVDEFSLWPGADRALQSDLESRLLARADLIVAASRSLERRFHALGREASFLPHGVDVAHWRGDAAPPPATVASLRGLPRPLMVFWGLVDRRLDPAWVGACQRATGGTVVLVGPQRTPDRELLRLPGVVRTGPVPYADLPGIAAASDALIMPYADLPVTRYMQPLKMLEYLCTDRPVVMRDLPATREWADAADVVASVDELCGALRRRLREGVPAAQMTARERTRTYGWPHIAERFWRLVDGGDESRLPQSGVAPGESA